MAATSSLFGFSPSRGVLVVAQAGYMPPRLLLVPAGTLLPPGVHAVSSMAAAPGSGVHGVAVAAAGERVFFALAPAASRVPLSAHTALAALAGAPGSGRRGATRCVAAGAGAGSGAGYMDEKHQEAKGMEAGAGNTATTGVLVLAPAAASSATGHRGAARSVAASATSEAGNTAAADDDSKQMDLDREKKLVLDSWAAYESGIGDVFVQPVAERERDNYELVCFADNVVEHIKTTASRGVQFVARVLLDLGPSGFSDLNVSRESDVNNIKIAGLRFRRVVLEAHKGYVRATSVRAAVYALGLLYAATLSTATAPAILLELITADDDVPLAMDDPAIYFKNLGDGFARDVEAAVLAFPQ